jgi:phosphoglycerate dehydrogenase-like enzyme
MKATAFIINTSRGPLIDELALIAALQGKRIAGAGLDVFESEPPPAASPLWQDDSVIMTPHVAGLSNESQALSRRMVAKGVADALRSTPPRAPAA